MIGLDFGEDVRRLLDAPAGQASPEQQALIRAAVRYCAGVGLKLPAAGVPIKCKRAGGLGPVSVERIMALDFLAPGLPRLPGAAGGATAWDGRGVEVYVDTDLSLDNLARVALHECVHIHDHMAGVASRLSPSEKEERAERFAADHVAAFLAAFRARGPLPSIQARRVELLLQTRRAPVATLDTAKRTAEVTFATNAAVERMDWDTGERYLETLSLDPAHIRIDRLNDGGPVLDSHSADSVWDILGAIVPGSVVLTRSEARATARFARGPSGDEVLSKIADGVISGVSTGYRVYSYEETPGGKGNKLPVRRAVDWEPFEVSIVAIPADPAARIRAANVCTILAR